MGGGVAGVKLQHPPILLTDVEIVLVLCVPLAAPQWQRSTVPVRKHCHRWRNLSIHDEISIFTADDCEMRKEATTRVEEFEHSR